MRRRPRYFVYALCDLTTGDVRYVGLSKQPEVRYQQHRISPTPVGDWFAEQERQGVLPVLMILQESSGEYWDCLRYERRWIDRYRKTSPRLLNRKPGRKPSNKFTKELSEH